MAWKSVTGAMIGGGIALTLTTVAAPIKFVSNGKHLTLLEYHTCTVYNVRDYHCTCASMCTCKYET